MKNGTKNPVFLEFATHEYNSDQIFDTFPDGAYIYR